LRGGDPQAGSQPPPLFCRRHPNGTDDKCGPCGDARRRYEAWTRDRQTGTTAPAPKPTKHIPGLCDAHRQPEDTCEMCARDAKDAEAEAAAIDHARAVIYGRFGGIA
jgi:hypothetical protein